MFTDSELNTIKDLALGALENIVRSDITDPGHEALLDMSTLPTSNFDLVEEGALRKVQDCQAIIKRCDSQLYKQAGLELLGLTTEAFTDKEGGKSA